MKIQMESKTIVCEEAAFDVTKRISHLNSCSGMCRSFAVNPHQKGLTVPPLTLTAMPSPPAPYVGQKLGIRGLPALVTRVDDPRLIEVDTNHPLAGEDVHMVLDLRELRKASSYKTATFAGGPFWGLELAFQRHPGVLSTVPGYTQGHTLDPTYLHVLTSRTVRASLMMGTRFVSSLYCISAGTSGI